MSSIAYHPELIISLSRDMIRLQLLEDTGKGRPAWESAFPVPCNFLEEHICGALDLALVQNPALMDHFDQVEVLVVDQPSVCVPKQYATPVSLREIAGRYLRLRTGDTLSADTGSNDAVIAYSMPTGTLNVLKEYYASAGHLHLASIVWSALHNQEQDFSRDTTRLFIFFMNNTLLLLGEDSGKLIFSRTFFIKDQADLHYYTIACSRMLRVKENWHITLMDENPSFELPELPHFTIHHHLRLPPLHALIASHRICES